MKRLIFVLGLLLIVFPLAAQDTTPEATPESDDDTVEVEYLVPQVLNRYPHDTSAFTQGLLLYDGLFYESTGLYGESTLRLVEPETGEVLERLDLIPEVFGEGLALVDETTLIQLTWRAGVAIVFDRERFEPTGLFEYEGEGWGLCYDGEVLYMSDGSDIITIRDPQTFEVLDTFPVTLEGEQVFNINELECVDDVIYANLWMTDNIVRIDKASGVVNAVIDASGLLTDEERADLDSSAVLNGIAYNAEDDTFFITGKLWADMFEVVFVAPDELENTANDAESTPEPDDTEAETDD